MRRRTFLQAFPVAAAGLAMTARRGASQGTGAGSSLVAFFTRTGNTRVIASQIRRTEDATLFEIVPVTPYPEDYETTVAQASKETGSGYLPPLTASVGDMVRYATVYLGFPIWGMTAPPVVRSFLRSHDLSGKDVRLFITHGGYGIGNSVEIVRSLAPDAQISKPFSMECDQERRTLEQVTGWLAG